MLIFLGTSISWVGYTGPVNGSAGSATYTVDGQDPINFDVPISPNNNTYFNQLFFETGQFPFGQHTLEVTYFGNTTTAPLVLNYFVQQDASSSNTTTSVPSDTSSSSSPRKSTNAIIGGVIGGVVFISLLVALFFFIRRRNNRKAEEELSEKIYIDPALEVADPFTAHSSNPTSTFLPQNYTSNGQSLPSQPIPNKLTQRGQPSDPLNTSSSGRLPPLTPLRPQFSSPAFISPSSSRVSLTGSQSNFDGTRTTVAHSAKELSMQQSSREADARILMHEDSGVRIPPAENNVVELPPFYTPG
jgi:hypothetical protein